MKRRDFIRNTATVASIPFIPIMNHSKNNLDVEELLKKHLPVNFTRDGINLPTELYTNILQVILQDKKFTPDSYGNGGMIHKFEEKVAKVLGKEKAIYMPSGTLANHIALRQHCTTKKRAIVQYNSHINRDSGDCATTLSGINLITLGAEQVIFDNKEFEKAINDSETGKVSTPIGVLSLESPIRRSHLQRIPFNNLKKITETAKKTELPHILTEQDCL